MRFILLASIAAAALSVMSPASAKTLTVTTTGTVTAGLDAAGLFGPAGADLKGAAFVATYKFDIGNDPLLGVYDATGGLISAAFSVNGIGRNDFLTHNGISLANYHGMATDYSVLLFALQAYNLPTPGSDYISESDLEYSGYGLPLHTQDVSEFDATTGAFRFQNPGSPDATTGQFAGITTLSSPIKFAFVPEPAMWALMLCGFGLAGGVLRRRTVSLAS